MESPGADRIFRQLFLLLQIILTCRQVSATSDDPAIQYKRLSDYEWIYDDTGTGSHADVSIWRPRDHQAGFCALGDVAIASHAQPTTSTVTINGIKSNAVAHPTSFTEIWNDRGSGGKHDVRIMRMNTPAEYKCIGYVAILGYGNLPPKDKYCCVHSKYVTQVKLEQVWKDAGSGASRDVSFWQVLRIGEVHGIEAANFLAIASHGRPVETPYLLNGSNHVVNIMSRISGNQTKPIHLYEYKSLSEIWRDTGSWAHNDVSFWRVNEPDKYYSLGDTAQPNYNKPGIGYMAKAIESDALRAPDDFREKWNDKGSGASKDVTIWEPICPSGYRALGYVTKAVYGPKPNRNDIRCVKAIHTVQGGWSYVWNDAGSGANVDCTVWMAVPQGSTDQGVAAMSAINHHGNMDRSAYVLTDASLNYYVDKPAKSYEIKDVTYNVKSAKVLSVQPDSMAVTVVKNEASIEQTVTRSVSWSTTESYSWSNSVGVEVGVQATFKAGIPIVGKSEITVSLTASYSHTWGGQVDETKTGTIEASINVPAKSQITATVVCKRYRSNVPYSATLVRTYYDDTTGAYPISGIYEGVNINEVDVAYGPDTPLSGLQNGCAGQNRIHMFLLVFILILTHMGFI